MKCNWYKPLVASVNHFSRNTQLAPITSVIHILNFLLTHILDCLKGGRLLRLPISEKNWKISGNVSVTHNGKTYQKWK